MKAQFFLSFALSLSRFAQENHPIANVETENIQPFSGKINTKKANIFTAPDVESTVVTIYNDGQFLTILGKVDNFYAVKPSHDVKLYVYKNFIVDGKVKHHNVNVRLTPDLNSPIVAKLQKGETVDGKKCEKHDQWIEIKVPKEIEFFVEEKYVDKNENIDMLAKLDDDKENLSSTLDELKKRVESELKSPYTSMDLKNCEQIVKNLAAEEDHQTLLEAKNLLHTLKEDYLSKKITSLEMQLKKEEPELVQNTAEPLTIALQNMPEEYRTWQKKEFNHFLLWSQKNPSKSFDTFLTYEKDGATLITGTIEKFDCSLDQVPGNFLLIQNGYPVAYLYCLDDALEKSVGKEISFLAQPRNNLDFAFPAFVALEITE